MSITTLQPPGQWAQNEFAFAELGDRRRNKRLVNIATKLAANPGGTLPQAFPDWAELKAAYRFFDNPVVDFAKVLQPHLERTRLACREPGEYLIIEDTSDLDFSRHRRTQDLGVIGDGRARGFELHSALAVRVEAWTLEQRPEGQVVGLFDQQCRRPRPAPSGREPSRTIEAPAQIAVGGRRLSERAGPPPAGAVGSTLRIGSRIFTSRSRPASKSGWTSLFAAAKTGVWRMRRAKLREALAQAPVLGQSTVELRSRGGEPARTAIVELRSVQVDLDGPWRPGGWQDAAQRGVGAGGAGSACARGSEGAAALDFADLAALPELGRGAAGGRALYGAVVGGGVS